MCPPVESTLNIGQLCQTFLVRTADAEVSCRLGLQARQRATCILSFLLILHNRENTLESYAYDLRDVLKRDTLADTLNHPVEMILEDLRSEALPSSAHHGSRTRHLRGTDKDLSCRIPLGCLDGGENWPYCATQCSG